MTLAINELCNTLNLVDPWRINNRHEKRFTWLQGVSNKQARLDYFLCNDELMSITKNYQIRTKYHSDHSPISCSIQLGEETRGPGTWTLNNSLLIEKDFKTMVIKEINAFKSI